MSSAIASLGGPSFAQWVRTVTKRKTQTTTTTTTPASSCATTSQSAASGNLLGEIQQAVTSALQSAQGDGGTNPNQVVEDAITKLLKSVGIGSSTATGATPTTATTAATPGQTPPSNAANQAFASLLQSVGISPTQFQADFQAAVRDAQRGSTNPNANLQSIPIGSTLDVTG
ncbi:MAG TPA: hypothetical protein VGG44_06520 [Tepidisphaeraceae bacterium]|jgi:hypothetical protein